MSQIGVCIKGAGEMASAVAWRLFMANFRNIIMLEAPRPLAVRRRVSFCEAVYDGSQTVEGVHAVRVDDLGSLKSVWKADKIAVAVDPEWNFLKQLSPDVVVDAILAKRNLGSTISEAPLVIALGPGFEAGSDVHYVIETNRGHNLGRIIENGCAEPNTGVPGNISGFTAERLLRAPGPGVFSSKKEIGDRVRKGEIVGYVDEIKVEARIDGVLRGLIRPRLLVRKNLKIGDIDPRGETVSCDTISDKARAISGSVLEAVLRGAPNPRMHPYDLALSPYSLLTNQRFTV